MAAINYTYNFVHYIQVLKFRFIKPCIWILDYLHISRDYIHNILIHLICKNGKHLTTCFSQ